MYQRDGISNSYRLSKMRQYFLKVRGTSPQVCTAAPCQVVPCITGLGAAETTETFGYTKLILLTFLFLSN